MYALTNLTIHSLLNPLQPRFFFHITKAPLTELNLMVFSQSTSSQIMGDSFQKDFSYPRGQSCFQNSEALGDKIISLGQCYLGIFTAAIAMENSSLLLLALNGKLPLCFYIPPKKPSIYQCIPHKSTKQSSMVFNCILGISDTLNHAFPEIVSSFDFHETVFFWILHIPKSFFLFSCSPVPLSTSKGKSSIISSLSFMYFLFRLSTLLSLTTNYMFQLPSSLHLQCIPSSWAPISSPIVCCSFPFGFPPQLETHYV